MNCKCKESQNIFNGVCGRCLLPLAGTVHGDRGQLLEDNSKKPNRAKLKSRVETEPDFINHPRVKNSLSTLMENHPEGVSDEDIAKFLMCSSEEVREIYESAIIKLRSKMKVSVNID